MARGFYGRAGVEIKDDLTGGLESLKGLVRDAAEDAVRGGLEIIRTAAYPKANVSPGERGNAKDGRHMRDCMDISTYRDDQGAHGRLFIDMNNVPYAAHQEFGMNGKPFIRPAIDETREEVRQHMRRVMAEQVGDFKVGTSVKKRNIA